MERRKRVGGNLVGWVEEGKERGGETKKKRGEG